MKFHPRRLAGFLVLVSALAAPAHAEFRGPLQVAAHINAQLALSNRMTGIAQAGGSLVAVGPRGHILRSDNGGRDWTQVPVPVASDLVAVRFAGANQGWAVGHDGVVLHSADAGKSWVKQLDGVQAAAFVERAAKERLAAGDKDVLAQQDFLARFVKEGADKPFLDVLFLDEKEGFIVGAFNAVFRTRDGGATWEPLLWRTENPNFNHLYALARHGGVVYAAGERGLLLRWNPQSERFTALASPYHGSWFGLLSTPKELVAYGLRGHVYATADGGATWRKEETGTNESLVSAAALSDGRYAIVTSGGKILLRKQQGGGFDTSRGQTPMAYAAVAAPAPDALVVVGSRGVRREPLKGSTAGEN